MSDPEEHEGLSLLPNRLAVADFNSEEIESLVGANTGHENRLLTDNFNWVAAYLVEEVGIFEHEVVDWFRSEASGLAGKTPIDVWKDDNGFWRVFEYAQFYKEQVDEVLPREENEYIAGITRSHELAKYALPIILSAFEKAGVDIDASSADPEHTRSRGVHNPHKDSSPSVIWKGNQRMEGYRVDVKSGPRYSSYFIVRYLETDGEPEILQTGIGETVRNNGQSIHVDSSDIDGQPPSAGEVARFIVPLANEVKNDTLVQIKH